MLHRPPLRPSPVRRLLALVAVPVAATLAVGLLTAPPAAAERWPGHPGRDVVRHVVKPGDTATGLAVRYHAWTAELLRINGLHAGSYLRVGETLKIPVVVAAARKARHHKGGAKAATKATKPRFTAKQRAHNRKMARAGWEHWWHRREVVKKLIAKEARKQGVPVRLAQAVAWMESGWHQPVVSPAGAIGVMQVLPTTATWMSMYAGRPLDPKNTHDNILAGVLLLKVLDDNTSSQRRALGAYYQGLGAVRDHGLYEETKTYVDNVLSLRRRVPHLP